MNDKGRYTLSLSFPTTLILKPTIANNCTFQNIKLMSVILLFTKGKIDRMIKRNKEEIFDIKEINAV